MKTGKHHWRKFTTGRDAMEPMLRGKKFIAWCLGATHYCVLCKATKGGSYAKRSQCRAVPSKANERIRAGMRKNEQELLKHLRARIRDGRPVHDTMFFSMQWHRALERLEKAGQVKYFRPRSRQLGSGYYKPVKFARPVTKLVA